MRWSSLTTRRLRLQRLLADRAHPRAIEAAEARMQWWRHEAPNDRSPGGVAAHREGRGDGFMNRSQRRRLAI
jgi:hypothetical protein